MHGRRLPADSHRRAIADRTATAARAQLGEDAFAAAWAAGRAMSLDQVVAGVLAQAVATDWTRYGADTDPVILAAQDWLARPPPCVTP